MLDVINNALKNTNYYICLYENKVYIYNYQEIVSFNHDYIKIALNQNNIKIKGSKMLIKKMHIHELLIEGNIESIKYE
ncbi:MAG: YabP/YqfC family sporulation protein [Bacilli bacterium]|nr:YabP/YqfC family sporulation protein [Bacilli bacterium]